MGKFKQMQIEFDDDYALINGDKDEIYNGNELYIHDYAFYGYGEPIQPTYYGDEPLDKDFAKTINRCSHKVKLTIGKKVLVTYCEKCGKILNQQKR